MELNKMPLRILIVCEHASNKFGGEAMLPLNYFRLLSQTEHNCYLITHERVKNTLSKMNDLNQENIFYIPDTKLHIYLHTLGSYLPKRISIVTTDAVMHLITQYYQRKLAKKLVKEKGIDVIHEPSPVSATQPSAMFGFDIPVIIGPMNGGMEFPEAFKYMSGRFEKVTYSLVKLLASFFNRLLPGKRRADLLLVANQRTQRALPGSIKTQTEELVENGSFEIKDKTTTNNKTQNLNILYVGSLIDLKCVDIAIDAVSATKTQANLTIVGDGKDRQKLMQYTAENSINNILFTGMIEHSVINQYYDNADIFILPSVRECGGAVVLEAMARGVPVIATNWGGPADYLTQNTGYLVDPLSRDHMVKEFARLIDELSLDPQKRVLLGDNAKKRIQDQFMWNEKIIKIISIYKNTIKNFKSKI